MCVNLGSDMLKLVNLLSGHHTFAVSVSSELLFVDIERFLTESRK